MSTFFRYTITDTGNLVSVEDELENVENYFKIQQYRFGDKLDMRVNFPDDYARILECKLPKLTLQPVVENAIFHGLEAKAEGGVIIISLEMTEKKLLINIHDDGIGIDEEELIKINQRLEITSGPLTEEKRKRGGIALPNVSRRIKLLFGDEYGNTYFIVFLILEQKSGYRYRSLQTGSREISEKRITEYRRRKDKKKGIMLYLMICLWNCFREK